MASSSRGEPRRPRRRWAVLSASQALLLAALWGTQSRLCIVPPVVVTPARIPRFYEVTYESAEQAESAAQNLDGGQLGGCDVFVTLDRESDLFSRVNVQGIGPWVPQEEVAKYFSQSGAVVSLRCHLDMFFGQVRFANNQVAWKVKSEVDGTELASRLVRVELDCSNEGLNTVLFHGLGPSVTWKKLREHCMQWGEVKFAAVHGGPSVRIEFVSRDAARTALQSFHKSPGKRQGIKNVMWPWDQVETASALVAHRVADNVTDEELLRRFNETGTVTSLQRVNVTLPPEFLL